MRSSIRDRLFICWAALAVVATPLAIAAWANGPAAALRFVGTGVVALGLLSLGVWGAHAALPRMLPELELFPERVEADALKQVQSGKRYLLLSLLCAAAFVLVSWFGLDVLARLHPAVREFLDAVLPPDWRWGMCVAASAISPFLAALLVRPRLRIALRRELNTKHGMQLCLHCGYDLRGQTEPRCPECGTPFDPPRATLHERSGTAPH